MHVTVRIRNSYIYYTVVQGERRNGKKEKNIVGMTVSAIPLRFILNGNKSIDEFMKELCQEIWECYKHQRYPLTDLMNDIRNESSAALDIYTTCVNYYGTNMDTFLNGIMIENMEFFNGEQEYHLQIIIREWERCSIQLDFDYQTAYCSKEDINMMFNEMMICIDELSGKTGIVNNLSLLSKRDCGMLQEFNHTNREFAQNKTVLDLFLFQVEKNANKIAIEYGNNTYTYEQVMRLVCYYEGCYKKITDIKNKIAVVMLPHSIEAVASILAVMKLGGIFLTLDKTLPFRRMQYIINDAEPDLIITDDPIEFETNAKIYNVNKLRREQLCNVCMNNENCADINGLAYIIYTSGSTGKPKGTLITQKGLNNYISWAIHEYIDDQPVSMPLFSSLSFDLTITSLFLPIMSGQRMIIYPGEDENEYVLNQIARENKCTIIKLTPAHLSILYAQLNKDSRLRKIIVGGENFQSELAKNVFDKLNQRVEIINEYGPTETVVGCSIHKYNPKDCGICVPIGRPIANTRIYILNKQMAIVPPGERGEICIDGIQVARGYLHQEQLTERSFCKNPFIEGTSIYKTGDLGYISKEGVLHYCGRKDSQVKINGYRIETEEIRKCLLQYEKIKDALIVIKNRKTIVAYIVEKQPCADKELSSYLEMMLPQYMIPQIYIQIDKIPLTVHGKVDLDKLPVIKPQVMEVAAGARSIRGNEELLMENLSVLLKEKVTEQGDFYMLGGDSIKAIQLSSRLSELGYQLRIKDILLNPKICDMATYLRLKNCENIKSVSGTIDNTYIMDYFFAQNLDCPDYYIQSILLKLNKTAQINYMKVLNQVIMRHGMLYTSYSGKEGKLFYNMDFRECQDYFLIHTIKSNCNDILGYIKNDSKSIYKTISLENTMLFRACLYQWRGHEQYLLLCAHHLVVDGVSWRILLEDMQKEIERMYMRKDLKIPEERISFQEWARKILQCQVEDRREREYWHDIVCKAKLLLPRYRRSSTVGETKVTSFQLNEENINGVLANANQRYYTRTYELLLASLVRTISDFLKQDTVLLKLEGHGREDIFDDCDVSRTVGWFTTFFPFVFKNYDNWEEQVIETKESIRRVRNNGIYYGLLTMTNHTYDLELNNMITFNYLGEFPVQMQGNTYPFEIVSFDLESSETNQTFSAMDISAYIFNNQLKFKIQYSKSYSDSEMAQFTKTFQENLINVINYCCLRQEKVFTPSDFKVLDLTTEDLKVIFGDD